MIITLNTSSKTFRYIFIASLLVFSFVLFAVASYSWTGPVSTPPNSNAEAPLNVSSTNQIKNGALSVNGLTVHDSSQYIQDNLGVGTAPNSTWRVDARGGLGGIYAAVTTGQAIRGHATSGGYAGYFTSSIGQAVVANSGVGYAGYFSSDNGGGVYAQNSSGYYAFLGYPGSSWSVYANGLIYTTSYSRADGGFCIAGSCKTSWGTMGSSYWTGWVPIGAPAASQSLSCSSGYVVTAIGHESTGFYQGSMRLLCTSLAP